MKKEVKISKKKRGNRETDEEEKRPDGGRNSVNRERKNFLSNQGVLTW